jgi:hypothetical protein
VVDTIRTALTRKTRKEPIVSKKNPEERDESTSIIQPMIDELERDSPPELPKDDDAPPPRGPVHPPQPTERGPNAGFADDPDTDSQA